jgi:hypothetical protein
MLFRHCCRARISDRCSYSRAATVMTALLTGDRREFFDKTMRFHPFSIFGPIFSQYVSYTDPCHDQSGLSIRSSTAS